MNSLDWLRTWPRRHRGACVMTRRSTITLILFVLGAAIIAWCTSSRRTSSPITTNFRGYTNRTAGRLGTFAISNSSLEAYIVVGYYSIQESRGNRRGKWIAGTNAAGASLPSGCSKLVTVPAPAHSPWRASLACRLDRSGDMSTLTMLLGDAVGWGFPTRYRRFDVRTDWVDQ